MNISRFFGSTSREAMRQVRIALGPDALIVSNRRVNGGVEILATDSSSVPGGATERAPMPSSTPHQAAGIRQQEMAPPPAADNVMGAIGALRGALEGRMDDLVWSHQMRRTPVAVNLFQSLLSQGFSTALLRAMLKRLPEELGARAALQWVRTELETHLPVLRSEDALWQPGLALALVGPTGVGKTTTLAKLAARAVRRFGPDKVVLLTTDTYRIGAHEQLKIYGDLMRVAVHIVQDVAQLRSVMLGVRPDQVILIDNMGISQRDRYVREQAALLAGAGRRVQRLLVLNAASQGDTLDEVARSYTQDGGTPLSGCIISKVDEAIKLGGPLDTAIRFKLPIHYVSNGQKVPEDLRFMSAAELVDSALQVRENQRPLYAPSSGDLAALLESGGQSAQEQQAEEERRARVLPRLLSAASAGGPIALEQARRAAADLDERLACAEAYDFWRDLHAQNALIQDGAAAQRAEGLMRAACQEVSEGNVSRLLVIHADHQPAGSQEQCSFSFLFSPKGQALSVPYYQRQTPSQWSDVRGVRSMERPGPAQALNQAMQVLNAQAQPVSLLHIFEGGSPTMWRQWADMEADWLALIPGATSLWHKDGKTTPNALSKQLAFHAIPDLAARLHLETLGRAKLGEIALWYAVEPVQLRQRNAEPVHLDLIILRTVRRHDGKVLKTRFALMHQCTGSEAIAPASLACYMMLRSEVQEMARLLSTVRGIMPASNSEFEEELNLLAAAQLTLASWDLLQAPDNLGVRQLSARLLGKPGLKSGQSVDALVKMLVLKEAMS
ncbi:flagellar biosynthesis protein FlhF [Alcaligenes faecalis]|uniref:flagellar biosynthesis protein FlhF n=1 Tax=Alcaligenes faecalis TaxID=511 RepID=UPI000F6704C2|nr:flagellar biosynthesis protein FlhF [Alcaligenes faecalis]MBQ0217259.1 flagellar biosynthesis protein FlhF [Alcaligenes faecalis]RSE58981.1 flagellar biosynthesis protein FlhF [Alcaligenes faecalis]